METLTVHLVVRVEFADGTERSAAITYEGTPVDGQPGVFVGAPPPFIDANGVICGYVADVRCYREGYGLSALRRYQAAGAFLPGDLVTARLADS